MAGVLGKITSALGMGTTASGTGHRLQIEPTRINLLQPLPDALTGGKFVPYLSFQIGDNVATRVKTKSIREVAHGMFFSDRLTLMYHGETDIINVCLWDDNLFKDTLIASGSVPLRDLATGSERIVELNCVPSFFSSMKGTHGVTYGTGAFASVNVRGTPLDGGLSGGQHGMSTSGVTGSQVAGSQAAGSTLASGSHTQPLGTSSPTTGGMMGTALAAGKAGMLGTGMAGSSMLGSGLTGGTTGTGTTGTGMTGSMMHRAADNMGMSSGMSSGTSSGTHNTGTGIMGAVSSMLPGGEEVTIRLNEMTCDPAYISRHFNVRTMDVFKPYIAVTVNGNAMTRKSTGKFKAHAGHALINETLSIKAHRGDNLVFELWDDNMLSRDTLIGTCTCPVVDVLASGSQQRPLLFHADNRSSGSVASSGISTGASAIATVQALITASGNAASSHSTTSGSHSSGITGGSHVGGVMGGGTTGGTTGSSYTGPTSGTMGGTSSDMTGSSTTGQYGVGADSGNLLIQAGQMGHLGAAQGASVSGIGISGAHTTALGMGHGGMPPSSIAAQLPPVQGQSGVQSGIAGMQTGVPSTQMQTGVPLQSGQASLLGSGTKMSGSVQSATSAGQSGDMSFTSGERVVGYGQDPASVHRI